LGNPFCNLLAGCERASVDCDDRHTFSNLPSGFTLQQGLMAPQPSSLRTSFRALSITRIEIKESVVYTAEGDRYSSSRKVGFLLRLN
jgi:hypothetical protein